MKDKILFWQSSRFAALVMALLIIAGTLIGAGRSLGKLKSAVDMAFYNGTDGNGFCIQRDLDERVISATNYITVARRYLSEDSAALRGLVSARDKLANAKGVVEKFDANVKLSSAVADMTAELEKHGISGQDAVYMRSIPVDMQSRNDTMSRDGYNDFASKYNETLERFPANMLSSLLGIEHAQLFR